MKIVMCKGNSRRKEKQFLQFSIMRVFSHDKDKMHMYVKDRARGNKNA